MPYPLLSEYLAERHAEDALDTLLTRSRAEAELGELATDVGRLRGLAGDLAAACVEIKYSTRIQCARNRAI